MKIRLKEIISICPNIRSVWPKLKRKTAKTNVTWGSILNTLNPWDKSHLGDSKISVGSFKMCCQLFLVMPLHYKLQTIIQCDLVYFGNWKNLRILRFFCWERLLAAPQLQHVLMWGLASVRRKSLLWAVWIIFLAKEKQHYDKTFLDIARKVRHRLNCLENIFCKRKKHMIRFSLILHVRSGFFAACLIKPFMQRYFL